MYWTRITIDTKVPRLLEATNEGDFVRTHALISEFFPRIYEPRRTPILSPEETDRWRRQRDLTDNIGGRNDHHLAAIPAFGEDPDNYTLNHPRVIDLKYVERHSVLWRVEPNPNGPQHLLIQSATRPDNLSVVLPHVEPDQRRLHTYPNAQTGAAVYFCIVANTITRSNGISKPIKGVTAKRDWIATRLHDAGLALRTSPEDNKPLVGCTPGHGHHSIRTHKKSDGTPVTLSLDRFFGIATVTNTEKLNEKARHGLGRAKAYGAGLLTVARPVPAPMFP